MTGAAGTPHVFYAPLKGAPSLTEEQAVNGAMSIEGISRLLGVTRLTVGQRDRHGDMMSDVHGATITDSTTKGLATNPAAKEFLREKTVFQTWIQAADPARLVQRKLCTLSSTAFHGKVAMSVDLY
jgi:hypothetical protein